MTPLSPQVIAILGALVEERLGLHYGIDDTSLFVDKLIMRMGEAGFESGLDYYYYLRYDPAAQSELDALADALVVGETYFFRELDALRAAITHVVAPAVKRRGKARIWSAGCATGEEPYSIAMLLTEAGLREATTIVATDLSERSLARARAGVYGGRALRLIDTPAEEDDTTQELRDIIRRYTVREGSTARVDRAALGPIEWRQLNLLDHAAVAAQGAFEVVLCRNVLIYFTDETVKRVVRSLAGVLRRPDGRLVIGASESLLRFGTILHCEERGGAFLYGLRSAEGA